MGDRTLQHICKAHKSYSTEANLAKELQSPTHSSQPTGGILNKPYKNISRKFAEVKRNKSIRLKAAFLLTVFSFNIVIGFACSVGLDMGFNPHHHQEEETAATNSTEHHHDEEVSVNNNQISIAPVENCCNQNVTQLAQADKAMPQAVKLVNPIFAAAFIATFYNSDVVYSYLQIPDIKYYLQNYHPPISDIRIAIQSFLI